MRYLVFAFYNLTLVGALIGVAILTAKSSDLQYGNLRLVILIAVICWSLVALCRIYCWERWSHSFGVHSKNIHFTENGHVETYNAFTQYSWKNGFLPTLTKSDVKIHSLECLYQIMVGNGKDKFVSEIRKKLESIAQENYSGVTNSAVENIGAEVLGAVKDGLSTDIGKIRADQSIVLAEAQDALQRITNTKLTKFKLDLAADISEGIEEYTEGFKEKTLEMLRKEFPFLDDLEVTANSEALPNGVKFHFTRGATSIFVIEQQPQSRTLNFEETFMEYEYQNSPRKDIPNSINRRVKLAFPYVVFISIFEGLELSNLYVFNRHKALGSIGDMLFQANLPNVTHKNSICLNLERTFGDSCAQRTDDVISYFWESAFNADHLENHYIPMKKRDENYRSIWMWEEMSRGNPQFALNAQWAEAYTLEKFINVKLSEAASGMRERFGKVVEKLLTKENESIADSITRHVNGINVETKYKRVVVREIEESLKLLSGQVLQNFKHDVALQTKVDSDEISEKIQVALSNALKKHFEDITSTTALIPHKGDESLYESLTKGESE